jgi:hypothetical protein
VLLAKSTLRLRVIVLDLYGKAAGSSVTGVASRTAKSDSISKDIADAAVLFKSGKGIGGLCDLSDLSGAYWVYPPVPASFPAGKVIQHAIPRFHHPRCPSFYPRLHALKGSVSMCMAGDSNSKRTCLHAQEHPHVSQGLSVQCRDFDHKLVTILSRPEKGYRESGAYNLEGFSQHAKGCVQAGANIIALNVGHHAADFSAADIRAKVFDPLMIKLTEVMSQRKIVNQAGLVWATSASHASFFPKPAPASGGSAPALPWPLSLLIKSNAYREVLQNQQLKCAIAGSKTCDSYGSGRGYGAVSLTYTDFFDQHHAKAGRRAVSNQSKARFEFVDAFHPTLALGSICHQFGDPVHFSSEYYWIHGFITKLLAVANACALNPGSCDGSSDHEGVGEHMHFNYLAWNPVGSAEHLTPIADRRHKWPSAYDFGAHANRYVFA